MKPSDVDWRLNVDEFHTARPGITERVLAAASSAGVDLYRWTLDALPALGAGPRLDVGCGTVPLATRAPSAAWVGADRSMAELALAHHRAGSYFVSADTIRLPFAGRTFDAVACTMVLQVITPLDAALAEIRRVVRSGGVLVALIPARRPLAVSDRLRYTKLSLMLRRRIGYPNDEQLAAAAATFRRAGLTIIADEPRRFVYQIADAETFVRSLYLPGVPCARLEAATRLVTKWSGQRVGIPLRRLVARSD